jgi:Iron-containing redox enzyme
MPVSTSPAAPSAAPSFDTRVQRRLNSYYLRQLAGPEFYADIPNAADQAELAAIEAEWMAEEVRRCDLADLPETADGFRKWYSRLFKRQIDQAASFFDYLAEEATLAELSFYIAFEEQVDGRFDDVIALAQIGLDGQAKLALARNYWEEMGEGCREEMHTYLFNQSAGYFRVALAASPLAQQLETTPEAIKNGNILLLMALNRRYALRLLGALTLLEHTAPHRFNKAVQAMRRLGVPEASIYYHEMHIRVDARHGDDLLNEIVMPMVSRRGDVIRELATGMMIRCNIATDYYDEIARRLRMV